MEYSTIIIIFLVLIILFMMPMPGEPDLIIWFYSPGCGHCTRMESDWKQMETMVGSNVKVQKVSTLDNPALAEYFNVQSVPHIVKTQGSSHAVYHGDRSAKDLYNFAVSKKNASTPSQIK